MLSTLTPRLRRSPRATHEQSVLPSPISISPRHRQFSPRYRRNTRVYLPRALAFISLFSALAFFLQAVRVGIHYLQTPDEPTEPVTISYNANPINEQQRDIHASDANEHHTELKHSSHRRALTIEHHHQPIDRRTFHLHHKQPQHEQGVQISITPHNSPNPSHVKPSALSHSDREHDKPGMEKKNEQHRVNTDIKQETLKAVPNTKWMPNPPGSLRTYKPLRSVSTRMRLVSMENACYCTQRNKFLLPRPVSLANRRFPDFLTRYGIAKFTNWKDTRKILAFPKQKVVHIPGTTVMWRGRSLHYYHAHLQRALIPIRSLIDNIHKSNDKSEIKLASENFPHADTADERVMQLHKYYLGDIKHSNRIELSHYRPLLVCFKRVFVAGTEFENHAASPESYSRVKELIKSHEGPKLEQPLVNSCSDKNANKRILWIMDRQSEHTHSGSMTNHGEVEIAVTHELIRAGLAHEVLVKTIQAPNLLCPRGTRREGCMSTDCSQPAQNEPCRRKPWLLPEVRAFNNMTFLVSTAGPGNNGYAYMPRGSTVVEISPHGVFDLSYGDSARDAGLKYFRMENRLSDTLERALSDRFGDVARSAQSCWQDNECRELRLKQGLKVDVHHLKIVLRTALKEWKRTCHLKTEKA